MELLPGVHHIQQDMAPVHPGVPTTINIVVGSAGIAIVDTGIPTSAREKILPYVAKLGRRAQDIVAIVNTHAHGDHLGSNLELKRASGAPIMAHELDAPALSREHQWGGPTFTAGPADRSLRDGEVIDLGDRELEVVHLPGHSPGSMGLFLRDQNALFTGDSLQGIGTAVAPLAFYQDPDRYVGSVRRALSLDVEHLLMAHPYYPAADTHVHGPDVRAFLETSLEFALGLDQLLLGVLRAAASPQDPASVADQICAHYGRGKTERMSTATVTAHLERMARNGTIRSTRTADETRYEL